jgi:hypothetical protein
VTAPAGGAAGRAAQYAVAGHRPGVSKQGAPHRRHGEGTMKSKQTGITLIGFLIVLVVVAFFGYMAMKLVPAYSEYMGVVKAMNQESTDGVDGKTLDAIRRDLMYKFSMQYVGDDTIAPSDITVTHDNGGNQLKVSYDKQTPFIYNIDFLVHFEKSVPLQGTIAQ